MTTGDLRLQVQILLQLGYPTQQIRTVNLSAQIWPLALAAKCQGVRCFRMGYELAVQGTYVELFNLA